MRIGQLRKIYLDVLNSFQKSPIFSPAIRVFLLRMMGFQVAKSAYILSGSDFVSGSLSIGEGVFINRGCLIDAAGGVVLGERVHLAFQTSIFTTSHQIGLSDCRAGPNTVAPVVIEQGVWIGGRTTVLPGVHIEKGVVIAAGSLVSKTCLADRLYAGVPAVEKKALS